MFGSIYFGQMYFAGTALVPVTPPVPPTPGEGTTGGGGRESKKSAIRSHHYRVDLLAPDSDVRKLIENARDRYAIEHPAKRARSASAKKPSAQIARIDALQKDKKICCAMSATFLVKPTNVDASVIQVINSRAYFTTNKHQIQAQIATDASYSTGLTDEETISLLQLV